MTVNELLEELQEWKKDGWGSATVLIQCEGFTLIDMDSDGNEVHFSAVPTTGVEEGMNTNGHAHIVIGREEPDAVKKRMCESGWWGEPRDDNAEEE